MKTLLSYTFLLAVAALALPAFQACSGASSSDDQNPEARSTGGNAKAIGLVNSNGSGGIIGIQSYAIPMQIQFDNQQLQFLFTLNVETGSVQNQAGSVVYQLTAADTNQLASVLQGSVYATPAQMGPCDPGLVGDAVAIAIIVTDQGSLTIAPAGNCQGEDLYNFSTRQPAGLEGFLNNLESEI